MKIDLSSIKFIHVFAIFALILVVNIIIPTNRVISETKNSEIPNENDWIVNEENMVQLQKDMNLLELIKAVSEINEETYILDESVKTQSVSIITPDGGMKKEDFLKFFDVILSMNGLSVIKSDGINKVINTNRIKEESTPTIIDLDE